MEVRKQEKKDILNLLKTTNSSGFCKLFNANFYFCLFIK